MTEYVTTKGTLKLTSDAPREGTLNLSTPNMTSSVEVSKASGTTIKLSSTGTIPTIQVGEIERGSLKLNSTSVSATIKPSDLPENSTLTIKSANLPTVVKASLSENNTLKLNSVNISDLSIEIIDTIQLPYDQSAYVRNIGTTKKAKLIFGIPQGATGNGIAYIELYKVEGPIKTYRIHYTNGGHYDYQVSDGDGVSTWGGIVGNIQDQQDLQQALSQKANESEVVKSVEGITPTNGNVNVFPDMTGQSGKVLSTDGTNLQWIANQASTFIYSQGVASDTWVITHNLDKYPSVTVVDSAENVVKGSVTYDSENKLTVTFNGGFKGKAYLN